MYRILANDGIDATAKSKLENLGYEVDTNKYEGNDLEEALRNFDVLIVRSATKVRANLIDIAADAGRLKLVVRAGVGLDNIDLKHAKERGITVRNTPMATSNSVAEMSLAHMFALSRFIHISNVTMRNGEWNKKQYKGIEIQGKTLGLIGFGRIARVLAKKAKALGMDVIYYDRLGEISGYEEFKYVEMDELLSSSDFISLHIPFIKEIGAVLAEKEFNKMKDGVYIINAARGGVVNEADLIKALDSGKVGAAALDVFEEEPTKNEAVLNHPKISLTPHTGASTKEAQARVGIETIDTIQDFFDN